MEIVLTHSLSIIYHSYVKKPISNRRFCHLITLLFWSGRVSFQEHKFQHVVKFTSPPKPPDSPATSILDHPHVPLPTLNPLSIDSSHPPPLKCSSIVSSLSPPPKTPLKAPDIVSRQRPPLKPSYELLPSIPKQEMIHSHSYKSFSQYYEILDLESSITLIVKP